MFSGASVFSWWNVARKQTLANLVAGVFMFVNVQYSHTVRITRPNVLLNLTFFGLWGSPKPYVCERILPVASVLLTGDQISV